MKPVEGTILTVIREASWYANHDFETEPFEIETYFDKLVRYSAESLERTPEYLPVLKEVGVVDSGGAGLLKILEGFKAYIDGNPIDFAEKKEEAEVVNDYAKVIDELKAANIALVEKVTALEEKSKGYDAKITALSGAQAQANAAKKEDIDAKKKEFDESYERAMAALGFREKKE